MRRLAWHSEAATASWLLGWACLWIPLDFRAASYVTLQLNPPAVAREFRGTWIATVNNIDWPSRRGLPAGQQRSELLAILNRAKQLNLNAVFLQVRPSCDAFYSSRMEPWSEYLSGRMGRPPQPAYDPLAFAVEEAHKRGLALHAWFNPYRAQHPSAKGPLSGGHISRTQPHLVRRYGSYLWLDPGEKAVEDYTAGVILDVVRRYDIDGVHLDDYFYPYPEKTAEGKTMPFPDESTYQRYRRAGGKLGLVDWRRNNANRLVRRLSRTIKAEKPWVQFGISPFGIWRSGYPARVKGLSAVDSIYADSRAWLRSGWLDYLAPQLYWSTEAAEQSFSDLLSWWVAQNALNRHVWPGISLSEPRGVSQRSAEEILRQITLMRQKTSQPGLILWSARGLFRNNLAGALAEKAFTQPALAPSSPWLDAPRCPAPQLNAEAGGNGALRITWKSLGQEPVRLWVLQLRNNNLWSTRILPGNTRAALLSQGPFPEIMAIRAVDRFTNLSLAAALKRI